MYEQCLYFNLNSVTRLVNDLWDKHYAHLGLSPAHSYLLGIVLDAPGLTSAEIASRLEIAPSTVSRFVDALADKGLLKRKPDSRDSRAMRIHPTRAARAKAAALAETNLKLYREVRTALDPAAVTELVAILRDIRMKARPS